MPISNTPTNNMNIRLKSWNDLSREYGEERGSGVFKSVRGNTRRHDSGINNVVTEWIYSPYFSSGTAGSVPVNLKRIFTSGFTFAMKAILMIFNSHSR